MRARRAAVAVSAAALLLLAGQGTTSLAGDPPTCVALFAAEMSYDGDSVLATQGKGKKTIPGGACAFNRSYPLELQGHLKAKPQRRILITLDTPAKRVDTTLIDLDKKKDDFEVASRTDGAKPLDESGLLWRFHAPDKPKANVVSIDAKYENAKANFWAGIRLRTRLRGRCLNRRESGCEGDTRASPLPRPCWRSPRVRANRRLQVRVEEPAEKTSRRASPAMATLSRRDEDPVSWTSRGEVAART